MKQILIGAYWLGWVFRECRMLLCRLGGHRDTQFVRNIYGDEIIVRGYNRSLHRCRKCGCYVSKKELHPGL